MKLRTTNLLLAGATLALAVYALAFSRPAEGETFAGTDRMARDAIAEVAPGYKPWFASVWEPPSHEIESLIFGLQAAAGAGMLCYALGYWRGRRDRSGRA